jgi:hypothetical protein
MPILFLAHDFPYFRQFISRVEKFFFFLKKGTDKVSTSGVRSRAETLSCPAARA